MRLRVLSSHDLRRIEGTVFLYCTIPPITRALECYLRNGVYETSNVLPHLPLPFSEVEGDVGGEDVMVLANNCHNS